MAERMNYDVPPTRTEHTATEALGSLLENLHQHGFLRLANDVVMANTQIAKVLVNGLNQPGAQAGIQNLSLLLVALSKIPPEHFNHLLIALTRAAQAMTHEQTEDEQVKAPGVTGALKMLGDDRLWQQAAPFFSAIKAFAEALQEKPERPVTRYSGKESNA